MQGKDTKPKEDPVQVKKPLTPLPKSDEAEDAELERKEEQMLDSTDDA
jgi:hypothetical protein